MLMVNNFLSVKINVYYKGQNREIFSLKNLFYYKKYEAFFLRALCAFAGKRLLRSKRIKLTTKNSKNTNLPVRQTGNYFKVYLTDSSFISASFNARL
jgi:hypothetical protein